MPRQRAHWEQRGPQDGLLAAGWKISGGGDEDPSLKRLHGRAHAVLGHSRKLSCPGRGTEAAGPHGLSVVHGVWLFCLWGARGDHSPCLLQQRAARWKGWAAGLSDPAVPDVLQRMVSFPWALPVFPVLPLLHPCSDFCLLSACSNPREPAAGGHPSPWVALPGSLRPSPAAHTSIAMHSASSASRHCQGFSLPCGLLQRREALDHPARQHLPLSETSRLSGPECLLRAPHLPTASWAEVLCRLR